MKRIIFLLTFGIALAVFGVTAHPELNERVIVDTVGIDSTGGGYSLTVCYEETDDSGGSEKSETKYKVKTGEGKTLAKAAEQIETGLGSPLFFGQTSNIVLGKSAIDHGVRKSLTAYTEDLERHPLALVAATESKAAEIIGGMGEQGDRLEVLLENADKLGVNRSPALYELMNHLDNDAAYLPLVKKEGESIGCDGGCLITGGKYLSKVEGKAVTGFTMLLGNSDSYRIDTEQDGKPVSIDLLQSKIKIKPDFGKFTVSFKCTAVSGVGYIDENTMREKAALEQSAAAEVTDILQSAVDCMKKHGTDAAFFNVAARHYGLLDGTIENMPVEISADINVSRYR